MSQYNEKMEEYIDKLLKCNKLTTKLLLEFADWIENEKDMNSTNSLINTKVREDLRKYLKKEGSIPEDEEESEDMKPSFGGLGFRINRDLWPNKTRERQEKEFQERLKIARRADRARKRREILDEWAGK